MLPEPTTCLHLAARERLLQAEPGPLFLGDWARPVFLHFAVPAAELQPCTPFPLDRWNGDAVVSLVAFTMRRMRFARCERLSEFLLWPFREQHFLNLRAYVTVAGEPGITFLREWISDRAQAQLGPRLYGLPYRWGRHEFRHGGPAGGNWQGRVVEHGAAGEFRYRAQAGGAAHGPAPAGSFAEFVLERHACFLAGQRHRRMFRIWHLPWTQTVAEAEVPDDSLLRRAVPWWPATRLIGAHVSDGAHDVWMGRPQKLKLG